MEASTTKAMERVRDALLEGQPIPADAQAALTAEERAEIASLAATAILTRDTLHAPAPSPEAEAEALRRATDAVTARPPSSERGPERSGVGGWFARLRGKRK